MTNRAGQTRGRVFPAILSLAFAGAVAACSQEAETETVATPAGDVVAADTGRCDRGCLIGLLDRYLAAVVAHAPQNAPLADDFRGTQNAVETPAGEGVWMSVTGLGALQRRYADPETHQAGYVGLIGEGASTAIVSLRIREKAGKISEAEWVIARDETPLYNPAGFTANPPPDHASAGQTATNPAPGETREAAILAAESYFDGIEASDAAGVIAFQDCYRFENGSWMVGRVPETPPVEQDEAQPGFNVALLSGPRASCVGGFQNFRAVTNSVPNRRYFFDAEAGVLWAAAIFERLEGATDPQGRPLPWVYLTNLFRMEDSQIRGIYAVTTRLPAELTTSGWPDEPKTP